MEKKEIFEKLRVMLAEQFGVEEEKITEESSFIDDLGADSLDIVELVMNIEEEFDIQVEDSDAERITTVKDVVEYLRENL